jgi:hypothetical protein
MRSQPNRLGFSSGILPCGTKLRITDVKVMFLQMKDHAWAEQCGNDHLPHFNA